MQPAFISFRSSQVHYSYGGNGNKVLLCLHGYGETENTFHFLEKKLAAGYLLIAIDMPWHGKTQWKEENDFTIADLLQIIDDILAAQDAASSHLTLLGFSMGGRMSLSILQAIPQRIHKMILLAPDGLKVNFWYCLATQTYIGNRLFGFTMKHPAWLFSLIRLGNKLKLLNRSVYNFANHYVHDKTIRRQLYLRWTGFRKIKPDLDIVKKNIQQHKIQVHLVYGAFDRIIRHERGTKFSKGIEKYCKLIIIQSGHQLLLEKNAALITGLL
jgi:pimeloyl-ACP methyl ester carboxylesterase